MRGRVLSSIAVVGLLATTGCSHPDETSYLNLMGSVSSMQRTPRFDRVALALGYAVCKTESDNPSWSSIRMATQIEFETMTTYRKAKFLVDAANTYLCGK